MVTLLAAPNMTQEDLVQMGSLVQEMDQVAQEEKLVQVLEIYYDASQRYRYASVFVPKNLVLVCMEHKQIYQSLSEKNIE